MKGNNIEHVHENATIAEQCNFAVLPFAKEKIDAFFDIQLYGCPYHEFHILFDDLLRACLKVQCEARRPIDE